jgi:hypothetical protein
VHAPPEADSIATIAPYITGNAKARWLMRKLRNHQAQEARNELDR